MPLVPAVRTLLTAAVVTVTAAAAAHAQAAAPKHTPVCAKGVRVYTDRSQVPVPHDTLEIPHPDGPVRVTSPEEAEAAELAMRQRAGSVGANAVLIAEESSESNGEMRIRRSVTGLFVPSDSSRALQACKP